MPNEWFVNRRHDRQYWDPVANEVLLVPKDRSAPRLLLNPDVADKAGWRWITRCQAAKLIREM